MKNPQNVRGDHSPRNVLPLWTMVVALILGLLIGSTAASAQSEQPVSGYEKITSSQNPGASCLQGVQEVFPERCVPFPISNDILPTFLPQRDVEFCRAECDECCEGVVNQNLETFLAKVSTVCKCTNKFLDGNWSEFLKCIKKGFLKLEDLARLGEELLRKLPALPPGWEGPHGPGGMYGPPGPIEPFDPEGGPQSIYLPEVTSVGPHGANKGLPAAVPLIVRWLAAQLITESCQDINSWTTDKIKENCSDGCSIYHGGRENPTPGVGVGGGEEGQGNGGGEGAGGGPIGCPYVGFECYVGPFEGFIDSSCRCVFECSQIEGESCFVRGIDGEYDEYCNCVAVQVGDGCDICNDPTDPYDPEGFIERWCDLNCI